LLSFKIFFNTRAQFSYFVILPASVLERLWAKGTAIIYYKCYFVLPVNGLCIRSVLDYRIVIITVLLLLLLLLLSSSSSSSSFYASALWCTSMHDLEPLLHRETLQARGSKAIYMADVIVSYTATHLITRADRFISLELRDLTSKTSGPSLKPAAGRKGNTRWQTVPNPRRKSCRYNRIFYYLVEKTCVEIQSGIIYFKCSFFIGLPFLDPFPTFVSFLAIHVFVHHDTNTKMTNKMQLCRIIYCSLTALHVSNDIFAHNQGHLNRITASGITHVCRC